MTESSSRRAEFREIERSDQAFAREVFAERELDSVFPQFADGRPITWGAVLSLASPGPPSNTTFQGVDWQLHIQLEPYDIEERDAQGVPRTKTIDPPVGILSTVTDQTTLNGARDIGRARLRSLLGYISIRTKLLFGATLEWEGASRPTEDGKHYTFTAGIRAHLYVNDARLEEIRGELVAFNPAALREEHRLALEWVSEAWAADPAPIQLANMWFALVVAVDKRYSRAQRQATTQMDRVKDHLLLLPLSQLRRDSLLARFEHAYDLRNQVVHEGNRSCVAIGDVEELFNAVSEFLLADIGRT